MLTTFNKTNTSSIWSKYIIPDNLYPQFFHILTH